MDVLIVMCVCVLVGNRIFPRKAKGINEKVQLICTLLLIFSMGVTLGGRPNFLSELASLGLDSLLYCLIPTALSVAIVYLLSKKFLQEPEDRPKGEEP